MDPTQNLTRETSAFVVPAADSLESTAMAIRVESGRVAESAWRIGSHLAEAREKIGAAALVVWARDELQLSRATTYRYLGVFEAFPDPTVLSRAGVSMRVLYKLAGSPEEVRDELVERIEDGEQLTEEDVAEARSEDLDAQRGVSLERSAAERRASNGDRWFTPEWLIDLAREVMGGGIDLDPATESTANAVVRAERIYTAADNGLEQRWLADRLLLNPPYSKEAGGVGAWIDHLIDAHANDYVKQAIVITKSKTETGWYRRLGEYGWRCQLLGRVSFVPGPGQEGDGAGWNGTTISYLGPNVAAFVHAFDGRGDLMPPRHWLEAALEDAAASTEDPGPTHLGLLPLGEVER